MAASSLAPRKAPRQARSQATHDAILDAAAQLLSRQGLAGYNTNAVAERAGVSVGSIYQYFPNKDALMVALIDRSQRHQLERVKSAVEAVGSADLETTVRLLVRAAQQHHRDDPLLASAIDYEEARLPVENLVDAYLLQGGAALRVLLEARFGDRPDLNIERAMRTLPALARAAGDAWANLSPPQLDVAEDEAVKAVLGYLSSVARAA